MKGHFQEEPRSQTVHLGSEQVRFECHPPDAVPKPSVFWMRNDVIILESEPLGRNRPTAHSIHSKRRTMQKKKPKRQKTRVKRSTATVMNRTQDDDDYEEEFVGDDEEEEEENEEHLDELLKKSPEEDGGQLLSFEEFPVHNYAMTNLNSLVIKKVTLADQANYTCGVHNPAGVRFSRAAQLTVSGMQLIHLDHFNLISLSLLPHLSCLLISGLILTFFG